MSHMATPNCRGTWESDCLVLKFQYFEAAKERGLEIISDGLIKMLVINTIIVKGFSFLNNQ